MAEELGADICQIDTVQPYKGSHNEVVDHGQDEVNRGYKPVIKPLNVDIKDYDVVAVGFLVWWYREPSIIDTFMEQYDFAGKTVVPFATSGGSSVGDSGKNMQALSPAAKVVVGKRFPNNVSVEELKKWASEWV